MTSAGPFPWPDRVISPLHPSLRKGGPPNAGQGEVNMARVLVIDDSPTIVSFIRAALEPDHHEVLSLDTFVDLPSLLRRQPPDVVFLDLDMPGLDGRKTGFFLRKFEQRRSELVIFSSRPREELEAVALELAAAAVLEKGTTPEKILELVALLSAGMAPRPPGGAPASGADAT